MTTPTSSTDPRGPFPVADADAHRRLRETSDANGVLKAVEPLSWLLLPLTHGPLDPIGPVPHEQANGGTALHLALMYEWNDVAAWFLPVSDLRAQDRDGRTPLMLALRQQRLDLNLVERLLEGSDVTQVDGFQYDALGQLFRTAAQQRGPGVEDLTRVLQRWPASLGTVNAGGLNAVQQAVIQNSGRGLQALRATVPDDVWHGMLHQMMATPDPSKSMTALGMTVVHNRPVLAGHLLDDSDPLQANRVGVSAWTLARRHTATDASILDRMALKVPEAMALDALRERGQAAMPLFHRHYETAQLRDAIEAAHPGELRAAASRPRL